MTTEELNNEVIVVPYFMVYTSDFKVIKEKLNDKQIVQLFNAISDLCLYGETDFVAENKFQAIWFEKLKKDFGKNLNKYKSCINNGKKGGRPKTEEKPIGFSSDNPEETQTKPKEKKRKEKNKIENNIIENKEENNNIESNFLFELGQLPNKQEEQKKKQEEQETKFNIFWQAYPVKKDKKKARDKFIRHLKNYEFNDIMKGLAKYKQYISSKQLEEKYIKHPTTWLNGECWNDEYNTEQTNGVVYKEDGSISASSIGFKWSV